MHYSYAMKCCLHFTLCTTIIESSLFLFRQTQMCFVKVSSHNYLVCIDYVRSTCDIAKIEKKGWRKIEQIVQIMENFVKLAEWYIFAEMILGRREQVQNVCTLTKDKSFRFSQVPLRSLHNSSTIFNHDLMKIFQS